MPSRFSTSQASRRGDGAHASGGRGTASSTAWHRAARPLLVVLLVGGLVVLGVWMWSGPTDGVIQRVAVEGTAVVSPDTVRARAGVPLGASTDTLATVRFAERAATHPWIQHATARMQPASGTFRLTVTERTPVGLAVGPANAPVYYLDAEGRRLPLVPGTAHDVPLVHGVPLAGRPAERPAPASLIDALQAIANDPVSQNLISDVLVEDDSTVSAYTRPQGDSGAIRVILGRDGFPQKFRRLYAFLNRMEASASIPPVRSLDVRFDGQIVARHREKAVKGS